MRWNRFTNLDILFLTASIWFLAKFIRYTFPPLFPQFQTIYGVSNATLGLAYSAMMLVYAAMQFPSGVVADKFGPPRVIIAGVLTASIGVFTLSASGSFFLLVGSMLLVGFGTGVHKTVAVNYLSTVYSDWKGRALGILDTFGALAGVAAPAAVVFFTDTEGWEPVFLGAGCVGLLLAGSFFASTTTNEAADSSFDVTDSASILDYKVLFRDKRFTAFVIVSTMYSFTYNGVVAFLPLYLAETTTLSSTAANFLYSVMFAVSFVQPVTGELSDRFGPLPVIGVTITLALAGLTGILVSSTSLIIGFAIAVFGLGAHGFRPVRGAYLVELVPSSLAGGGLGAVRTSLMVAGALAPTVVGVISENVSFRVAFTPLVLSLAVSVVVVFSLLAME